MRKLPIFFLILLVGASGGLIALAQYGEESTSLGQFVDEFTDSNNVSVTVNVVRNSTLNAMELNFTQNGPVFENFTTYTEVDEDGDVTVNDFNITWSSMRRDAETYVWKDFGAGFFVDFQVTFQINITDLEAGDGTSATIGGVVMLSNNTGVGDDLTNFLGVTVHQDGSDDDEFRLRLWERKASATVFLSGQQNVYAVNDPLYVTVNRTGAGVIMLVYSDEARTTLIQNTTTQTGNGDVYRYNLGLMNWGRDVDPADHMTGYVDMVSFGSTEGFDSPGHFSTTNYLDYANGSVLVQMMNTTIPATTSITVEFSQDNSTWINSTVLTGGFESIDLRTLNWTGTYYLNFTMTGTLTATPRVYQSRLITTEGLPVPQNISGVWVDLNASAISVNTGNQDSGNLASLSSIDGDTFNISEVVGVPGAVVSINFSGLDPEIECIWVTAFYHYSGNLTHDYDLEFYNFTSGAFQDDGHFVDSPGNPFTWLNSTIYGLRIPTEFLNNGEVRLQITHESPGNINHVLALDYLRLVAKIPSDVEAVSDVDIFPWIAIAIILSIITYLLARET